MMFLVISNALKIFRRDPLIHQIAYHNSFRLASQCALYYLVGHGVSCKMTEMHTYVNTEGIYIY